MTRMALAGEEIPNEADVLIVGSGFAALACAVALKTKGLDPVIVEKAGVWGGTSARSLGVMWLPGHPHAPPEDSVDRVREYLTAVGGNRIDAAGIDTFLSHSREAFTFFEGMGATRSAFPPVQPDYQPELPGGVRAGRTMRAVPFDGATLGADFATFAHPLRDNTAFNGLIVDGAEVRDFFHATRRPGSALKVMRLTANYLLSRLRFGRDRRLAVGAALTARMGAKARELGVRIHLNTALVDLEIEGDTCKRAIVRHGGDLKAIAIRRCVVLASGGVPQNPGMIAKFYPQHAGGRHMSLAPAGNTGEATAAALRHGARMNTSQWSPYAFMPVSVVPDRSVLPRIALNGGLDRAKPGMIIVDRQGRRFANEAQDYHRLGREIAEKCADNGGECYLVCDRAAFRNYGLGAALPIPGTARHWERTGYLVRGESLKELAAKLNIDAAGLSETVLRFNRMAAAGVDEDFGRGRSFYDTYIRSVSEFGLREDVLGPLGAGPYYAIRLIPGDIGTFAGLTADAAGRIVREDGAAFRNLYAIGNDRASIFGGFYPGPGITLGPCLVFGYIAAKAIAGEGGPECR